MTRRARWAVALWVIALLAVGVWQIGKGNGVMWAVYTGAVLIWVLLMWRGSHRSKGRR